MCGFAHCLGPVCVLLHPLVHNTPTPPAGKSLNTTTPLQASPHCGNQLLAAFMHDSQGLMPHMDSVHLTQGQLLHVAGQNMRYVYFPVNCIVVLECTLEDGNCAEFALTGREGMVGVSCFADKAATNYGATVLCEGTAWRMPARMLRSLFEDSGRLRRIVLAYMHALMTDAAQRVVCIRRHSIEQQLCRTLLTCMDRKDEGPLMLTQELIARTMGVRREAVTLAALKLQATGLIAYARGHITVLDRKGIEQLSCECYRIVSQSFQHPNMRK